eukprot:jgi/Undpi1/7242/HiC_scaffold_22.g09715.m1
MFCYGQELPLAATGLLDMITIVLAGKNKPTASQLKRPLGSRKHMVRDLIEYMQDKDGSLVCGFCLARRKASVNETNLNTYPSDGSVPQELLDAVLNPQDPNNLRGKAPSSYTNDRRESEATDEDEVSSDEESSEDSGSENDTGEDGKALFNYLFSVGAADGKGGTLAKVQAYIGLDQGAVSAYIACPSVSADLSTQDENTSSDPWPKPQETRAARCDKEEPTFGYVSGNKPLVKYRLCMPRAALATKMMVVLWNRGTCSHTVKMCAVAPPLCRLDKKTLPGLRTLPSFLIAGGGAGFA